MSLYNFNVGDQVEIQAKRNNFNLQIEILEKHETHIKVKNLKYGIITDITSDFREETYNFILINSEIKLHHLIKTILNQCK